LLYRELINKSAFEEIIMTRKFIENDLTTVIKIWFDTNTKAHNFIPKEYWRDNYTIVREMLP